MTETSTRPTAIRLFTVPIVSDAALKTVRARITSAGKPRDTRWCAWLAVSGR